MSPTVIRVISSEHNRLPLFTQLRTYRCIALSDAKGHFQTLCTAQIQPVGCQSRAKPERGVLALRLVLCLDVQRKQSGLKAANVQQCAASKRAVHSSE